MTLSWEDLVDILHAHKDKVEKLKGEIRIIGGVVKRGWTRSNVDLAYSEVDREAVENFERTLKERIRATTGENIEIMRVDWDFANKKIGINVKRDVLPRPKLGASLHRSLLEKVTLDVSKEIPPWYRAETEKIVYEEIMPACERVPDPEDALTCTMSKVYAKRERVILL